MRNTHRRLGKFVKVGYTERSTFIRARELSEKWHCHFEVVWEMPVYYPALAEQFLHQYLSNVRVVYEFFNVEPDLLRSKAEEFFDKRWREIEGEEIEPPSLDEFARLESQGHIIEIDSVLNDTYNSRADSGRTPPIDPAD